MQDLWLAVDGRTSAAVRARQLQRAWERFLGGSRGDELPDEVRAPIAESWRRARQAGFEAPGWLAPIEVDESEAKERLREHPLGKVQSLLASQLRAIQEETEHLLVLSDAHGTLLTILGQGVLRERAASNMNFVEGARWSEAAAGTNAVGLAIAADHGVQVFASEHFNENVHAWTCSAAPVHDPVSGAIVGVVDLTGPFESAHRLLLPLVQTIATTMERFLADIRRDEDDRLRVRYGDLSKASADLLTSADGRVLAGGAGRLAIPAGGGAVALENGVAAIAEPLGSGEAYLVRPLEHGTRTALTGLLRFAALGRDRIDVELNSRTTTLTRRQSEILVLLAAHADGLTADQLALALYGDFGKPVSARAEVSRLRSLLGDRIRAEPYRLQSPFESDIDSVKRLLRQGRVGAAAELYTDVLLPRSEAPGVIDLRDELAGWVRRAIMTADDPEALWSWVSHPSGADDLPAWVRFLSAVPYEDGRRPLAAAHVARLRRQRADIDVHV